ncbi:hypothetical protein [Cytobacillus sp. IB215316]|uniref:hypothetical protein n=1 Tax=Cytobacillus sp. IB215316 TaxID=3097354 RepID=UPI002A0DA5C9|nr:hypothetical protein [Cytobacillus sp. IB215316]MDX8361733.1 hypothetical protein [Cytobacillus sp. IB215316]
MTNITKLATFEAVTYVDMFILKMFEIVKDAFALYPRVSKINSLTIVIRIETNMIINPTVFFLKINE